MPPTFLEHILILCFEKRYPKQNRAIRLKSNILALNKFFCPPYFWAGYATVIFSIQTIRFISFPHTYTILLTLF